MRVRAVAERLSSQQREAIGGIARGRHFAERVGVEHLVLGMQFGFNSRVLGSGVWVCFEDEAGNGVIAPLVQFEVIDPRASRHWELHQPHPTEAMLWPRAFQRPHFFEDVADGVVAVRVELGEIRRLLKEEESQLNLVG
jgi:hypothetical protein